MSEQVRYAACCKGCGHIVDKAWSPEGPVDAHSYPTKEPLTPRGRVPIYCPQCGERKWHVPATKEQIEAFDTKAMRTARVVELTAVLIFEGIDKVPDEIKTTDPLIRRALANILAPFEGETLKAAQQSCIKMSRSGMQCDPVAWIDHYDRAAQKATAGRKATA